MQQYITKNLIYLNMEILKAFQDDREKVARIEKAKKLMLKQTTRADKEFIYSLLISDLNNKNNG